ncbi:hypothetical protein Q7P35_005627 [Cladosporium inversicolor]
MNIHPSQRRFACEVCKKNKAKCQRLQQTDLKCSRCMMLGVECRPGSQKKVGRPRRSEGVFVHKVLKSTPVSSDKKARKTNKECRQPLMSHQSGFSAGGSDDRPGPVLVPSQIRYSPVALHPSMSIRAPKQLSLLTEPTTWDLHDERVRINTYNGTYPTDRYVATIMPPLSSSSSDDTSDRELDWPDIATIPTSILASSPAWLSPPSHDETRYYTPEATRTMYFDTRLRTVMDESTSFHRATTNHSQLPDIVDTLSRIRKDMDLRRILIRRHKPMLSLNALIYRQSPLFINNYTLSEFLISTSQDFLHILTRLQASRKWKPSAPFHITAVSSPERLPHALAHTISSIFSGLISFYELFLEHLTSRIEHISTDPVAPIPGLTLNGKPLARPCDQGLLFCDVALGNLERMEDVLGLEARGDGGGLLSAKQVENLWGYMDGSDGVASGEGVMRPADVKALFRKMAVVFERLALTM